MGIPTSRFTDVWHEKFVCSICLDVALDPVVVNNCQHIFCRTCINTDGMVKCPTCREPFREPNFLHLDDALMGVYQELNMNCPNPNCHDIPLTITTYQGHKFFVTYQQFADLEAEFKLELVSMVRVRTEMENSFNDRIVAERRRMEHLLTIGLAYFDTFDRHKSDLGTVDSSLETIVYSVKNEAVRTSDVPSVLTAAFDRIVEAYDRVIV